MLKLIIGVKGTGKTKTLISMVNDAVAASNGAVICIEKGDKLRFDVKYQARLIDTNEYFIDDAQSLFGFVAGIFAICQSSEIFFLSLEERLELLRFIVKNAPEGMTIVASGHTADDLDTQIKEANMFIDEGIDGYVFISNRLAKADEDDSVFLKNMEYVVNKLPEIGLGVYECPYPYKRRLNYRRIRTRMQHCFRIR